MKFLSIIIFLLFPSFVFGEVGDVYYCTGENHVKIENHKVTKYKPQNFKFKRSEKEIKFGSDENYFQNLILEKKIFSVEEQFQYSTSYGFMSYIDGKFHFTMNTYDNVTVVTGKCSTF
jgi:hypothetical protein